MTDGETLLLVFTLLYLSDCLLWVNQSAFAIVSFQSRRFFVRRAAVQFAALRGGFAVLNPFPPFGTVFIGQAWPISVSKEGIAPYSRENPNPGPVVLPAPKSQFIRWDQVERISADEKKIRINRKVFAIAATRALARHAVLELIRLHGLPAEEREAVIRKWVKRGLRTRHVERRAKVFRKAAGTLRFLCIVLFVMAFLVAPPAYWYWRDHPRFFFILIAIWLLMLQICVEFILLHRRFYPALGLERWQHFFLAIVLPQYAIRSVDVLSKGFLAEFHPVAIAQALATPEESGRLTAAVWRDARHPIPDEDTGPAAETAAWFHENALVPALEAAFGDSELANAVERDQKAMAESEYTASCPRCLTPYDSVQSICEDCGGIPVRPNRVEPAT